MNKVCELPDKDRIAQLEKAVEQLEHQAQIDRINLSSIIDGTLLLFIPTTRISLAIGAGQYDEVQEHLDTLFKQLEKLQQSCSEFGALK